MSWISSPKVNFSDETKEFVNHLMLESRLTTSQRKGFESLLRTSNPIPYNDRYKHNYLIRRVKRANTFGLEINSKKQNTKGRCEAGGRRSLESIKASGDLNCPQPIKQSSFTGRNKEIEKIRFSYKMSYGHEPSEEVLNHLSGNSSKGKTRMESIQTIQELQTQHVKDLEGEIKERIEFLNDMKTLKQDGVYEKEILNEIERKMEEIKLLSPHEGQ